MELKIAILFIVASVSNVLAIPTYSQVAKVSLDVKNMSLEQVMDKIENQSEFYFIFNQKQIDVNRTVDIQVENKLITDILPELFKGTNVNYVIIDRKILLTTDALDNITKALVSETNLQQSSISGTVTDASTGEPMTGVNIQVKGTFIGATSDIAGKYSIPNGVDQNATLIFSFVGYVTEEIPLAGKNVIDVALKGDLTGLEEVVVIGYGTQKRVNVVGAVTSISGPSLVSIPSASVSNSISGRLPGSIIMQQSGEPGNLSTRILVRGRTNLGTSTYPLVVIDGIIGRSMDDIDPLDIESLSVLKDASAAIYGAQSANGVILITTKRGHVGLPKLNYQFYQGFMTATIVPRTTNAWEYATMLSEFQDAESVSRTYSDKDIALYKSGADPWEHPNTNWYGDLIKDWTTNFKHTLTLDGGFKGVLYYLSVGLKGDESFYKTSSTKYKQYNVRAKLDLPVTTWLKMGFDFAGIQNDRTYPYPGTSSGIIQQTTILKPTLWSYWPNGLPGPDLSNGENPVVSSTFQTGKDEQLTYQLQNTFRINITPPFVKGLSLNGQFNYDITNFYRHRFYQPWILYFPKWETAIRNADGYITDMDLEPTLRGLSSPEDHEDYSRSIGKTINLDIQYARKFGDHNVTLFGGFEQYTNDNNNFYAYRKNYVSSLIQTLDAGGDAQKTNSGRISMYARKSWIFRATYDYQGKYLAELLFRRDGSLKFPPESRWGNFPGLLIGWRASEEDFWKNNIHFIDYFKLRASYGKMGMDPGLSFQYINKFSLDKGLTFGTGSAIENVAYLLTVANPNITWEKQTTRNVGFDSKFFKGLLHLNVEFFYNKREDILTPRDASVPNFTGLSLPDENIARVDNKGFEIDAGIHKSLASDFHIDVTGNFSLNHNKIVFMDEPERVVPWQVRTGHPYGALLRYQAIGIFADDAALAAYPHWTGAEPGDVIFEDVNKDDKINSDDMILMNDTDAPKLFYGASLDVTWKDFALSVLIQGQGKYLVQDVLHGRGENGNYFYWDFKNRWTPTNINTDVARAYNSTNAYYWLFSSHNSTYWYDNMAYCRLKNLVLSYHIPSQFYRRFGISSASVYFSGNNLALIWAAQRNFDPEIANPEVYPAMKTFAFGANVKF